MAAAPVATPAPTPEPVTPAVKAAEPVAATADPPTDAATPEPTPAPAPVPAFKLPDDLKVDKRGVEKFDAFIKAKAGADGKLSVTAQDVVDLYADQARDGFQRWQEQIAAKDAAWATESKKHFDARELSISQAAVAYSESQFPGFRDLAKTLLNHPGFVSLALMAGRQLNEDVIERGGQPPRAPGRAAKDILYPKKTGT